MVRDGERRAGVLLDQQDRAALRRKRLDHAENLGHDQRRQTEARLVQHQQAGLGHQRPAHGEHLPLTAAQCPGVLRPAFMQAGKGGVDRVDGRCCRKPAAGAMHVATQQ